MISYYRLSGYWYPMLAVPKTSHNFKSGSTFNNAYKLYCFDRELRKLILGELEKIEIAVRTKMIYELSHRHGAFWYRNPSLFTNATEHQTTLTKILIEYKRSDEIFIVDFRGKYNDPMPPSWIMLQILSFGSLSKLYKNLVGAHDRRIIANYFGLDDKTFESWLHNFVYIRNVCAHHSRLWSRVMRITPRIPDNPSVRGFAMVGQSKHKSSILHKSSIEVLSLNFAVSPHYCKTLVICWPSFSRLCLFLFFEALAKF